MNKMRIIYILILLCVTKFSFAVEIKSIKINGINRVDQAAVKSLLSLHVGEEYNEDESDNSIKSLYASELFDDVKIYMEGNELVVDVKENPKVNKIVFEGNNKLKESELKKEIQLTSRGVFSKSKLQSDINKITEIYRAHGKHNAQVGAKLVKHSQNRVDVVFEIDEGKEAKIAKITFLGNKKISDSNLKNAMISSESAWYRLFSSTDKYNADRLEVDKDLIVNFYKSKGYAEAKVLSTSVEMNEDRNRFYITFNIEEGKKFKYGDIKIISQLEVDESKILKLLEYKKGNTYNIEKINQSNLEITSYLNDKGYPFAEVDTEEIYYNDSGIANINIVIKNGERVYVRHINIKGNTKTHDNVIRRYFRLQEGDPLNTKRLKQSESELLDLDYFSAVNIEQIHKDQDKVDLDVTVEEKSTTSLTFAAGYNTVYGPVGSIGLSDKNLFGKGRIFDISLAKAKRSIDIDLSVTDPQFMDMPILVGFDIYKSSIIKDKSDFRNYNHDRKGVGLKFGYTIFDHLTHVIRYNLEFSKIYNVSDKASLYIKEQAGKKILSSIGQRFTYDVRDSKTDTKDGYLVFLDQTLAGIGGNVKFLKHEIGGAYYKPVFTDDIIFHSNFNVGNIRGLKGQRVRVNDRFFLGGEQLFGFNYSGVGPRAKVCKDNKPDACSETDYNGDSTGGNNYYRFAAEVRYPLGTSKELGLYGVAFFNAGEVFSLDSKDSKELYFTQRGIRTAAGLGVGLITPLGPLKLTYSWPLNKKKFDHAQSFLISFSQSLY